MTPRPPGPNETAVGERLHDVKTLLRFAALALIAVGVIAACAPPLFNSDGEIKAGPVGEVEQIIDNVGYYPACGNETLEVNGVTWFPFAPAPGSDLPAYPLVSPAADGANAAGASVAAVSFASAALPRVAPPDPGDDVGTMVVFEGGLAYWQSENGEIDTWLTTRPITYNFVC